MKKTLFFSVLALTLFITSSAMTKCPRHPDPIPILAKLKWSHDLGAISWTNANRKCKQLGMRLPTEVELRAASSAKATELKNFPAKTYWTSTQSGAKHARYYEFCYSKKLKRKMGEICSIGIAGKNAAKNYFNDPIHARCVTKK